MKLAFNRISHSLLLSGSILTASITPVLAHDNFDEQVIAMYQPASTLAEHFSTSSKLSAEKLLSVATNLSRSKKSIIEEKLEFALVFSAATKGLAEAQFRLANYYIDSELVAADDNEASYWLEEAMAQGHQGAKFIYESLGVADFDIGC